jgi:hypothetical protein
MNLTKGKLFLFIFLWIASLLIVAIGVNQISQNHDQEANTEDYQILYEGSSYSPFISLSEAYNCTGIVEHSYRLSKNRYLCKLIRDDTLLGQIDICTKDGAITDFYSDGQLCDISNDTEDLILVIDNQVYIQTDPYSDLLSVLN